MISHGFVKQSKRALTVIDNNTQPIYRYILDQHDEAELIRGQSQKKKKKHVKKRKEKKKKKKRGARAKPSRDSYRVGYK